MEGCQTQCESLHSTEGEAVVTAEHATLLQLAALEDSRVLGGREGNTCPWPSACALLPYSCILSIACLCSACRGHEQLQNKVPAAAELHPAPKEPHAQAAGRDVPSWTHASEEHAGGVSGRGGWDMLLLLLLLLL